MKCPIIRDEEEIASLYVEYIYDSLDKSLPNGFYNKRAMLYIMDAESERLVLKPKGMGERSAGHLNLEDFSGQMISMRKNSKHKFIKV